MMSTTDTHALAGAFVLDAVDDIERAAFTRHLAQCETCQTEVDEMREAAARLADGTFSVPPPRMRTDVMAAIARTRQLAPGVAAAPERDAGVVSRWRRFTAGAAAACILTVGAGAATYAIQEQRVQDQRSIAAAVKAEAARTQAILTASDVVVRTSLMAGGGRVTVAMSPAQNAGVVLLAAATAPPAGKAFQLWTIAERQGAVSAGILAAGVSSASRIIEGLPANETFAVTVEPATATGSAQPTTPIVATVPLI